MRGRARVQRAVSERPGIAAVIVLAVGAALALIGLTGARAAEPAAARGDAATVKRIAEVESNGFRLWLTAARRGERGAIVRIAAFARRDGDWKALGRPRRVSTRWFWHVVTGRFGVHTLKLRLGGRYPLRATVRLLQSASLGPSAPFRFVVHNGRLMPVDV